MTMVANMWWFQQLKFPLLLAALVVALSGCSVSIPADPDGTLDRVRTGVLRVGISPNPPWTVTDANLSRTEVELVRGFADRLDADIEWTEGGEEMLVTSMERGELDLLIGGLTAKSPWVDKVALTAPYAQSTDDHGKTHDHVMAVPMGENAFLFELESFLIGKE
jgi:polar amino acid transport system substrate-binding protein